MKDSQPLKKKQNKFIQKNKPKKIYKRLVPVVGDKKKSGSSFSFASLFSFHQKTNASVATVPANPEPIKEGTQTILKKHETDIQLILIPLTLFLIFLILSLVNNTISQTIVQNKLAPSAVMVKVNAYPFVQKVQMPVISAKAGIVTDVDSQVTLFSKNPKLRFSMASTTKIMTALTAFDYYKDDSILTVARTGVEGSVLGLVPGDTFYFKDLLYAMLLPSANDAAYVIADNYPGGVDAFVSKMNEKAALLHLTDTHFADPTGLDDDGDFTTVIDMARLASAAIKNKEFTQITSTKQKIIATTNYVKKYELNNLNKLLGIDGVYGIKTGTTEGAGEVLVTSTEHDGHTFIIVVMNSHERYVDTQKLLSFISQNVTYISPIINAGESIRY